MSEEQEQRIKELEKQVKDLTHVRGIVDAFGSYKSLKKDAEIIQFFLRKENNFARWIEVVTYFTQYGWAKSTIESHLRNLKRKRILTDGALPGEYKLHEYLSKDMDLLVQWLVESEIYDLAKKSWENKVHY